MKKDQNDTLHKLPCFTPLPDGLTTHPYQLLATISAEMIKLEPHFTPEAYNYMRDSISQILKGTDPKVALRLNIRKRNEEKHLIYTCMVLEMVHRFENGGETLVDITTDLVKKGYTWNDKDEPIYFTKDTIDKQYEKISPIIKQNRRLLEVMKDRKN